MGEESDGRLRDAFGRLEASIANEVDMMEAGLEAITRSVQVFLPVDQVVTINLMASVDTVTWWCLLCRREGSAKRQPDAMAAAVRHLADEHCARSGEQVMSGRREAPEAPAERGRVIACGRRTDDGVRTTLQLVHEADGSWTVHGPAAPGVQLSAAGAASLAVAILGRREPVMAWYLVSTTGPSVHHGVVVDGRLTTGCGGVFAAGLVVGLCLDLGQCPPDSDQVCPLCLGEAQ